MGLSDAREAQMLAKTSDFKDRAAISVVEGELIQSYSIISPGLIWRGRDRNHAPSPSHRDLPVSSSSIS